MPSRSLVSTPHLKSTGPAGSRRPPTAVRCCARAATARLATDLPDDVSLMDLGSYQLRGFDGRERLYRARRGRPGAGFSPAPARVAADRTTCLPRPRVSSAGPPSARRARPPTRSPPAGHGGRAGRRGQDPPRAPDRRGEPLRRTPTGSGSSTWRLPSDRYLVAVSVAEAPRSPARARTADPRDPLSAVRRRAQSPAACWTRATPTPREVNEVVSRLLAAGPGVRVLATSRESLSVAGETVWRIPPMVNCVLRGGCTGRRGATTRRGRRRPRDGRPSAEGELTHLLRVAQRLNGLPLALEFAAARLRLFSAAQLADRLDDLLGTLDAGGPNTAEYPVVKRRPATAQHAGAPPSTGPTAPCRRRRRRYCASSVSSPASSTWKRSNGSPEPVRSIS